MSVILGIDPGPERSAWLVWDTDTERPRGFAIQDNEKLVAMLRTPSTDLMTGLTVIEQVQSYGMSVGAEVFETVYWSGRFAEAVWPAHVVRITRPTVKTRLCGTPRAKDGNVRQALMDRFGGSRAKGTKKDPGPLYGISKDVWSALALVVAWGEA